MINPVIIIITAAVLVSIICVSVINKPRKPVVTGTLIIILVFFIVSTFMIDNAMYALGTNGNITSFLQFIILNDSPSYSDLESSFGTFMIFDICLIGLSLICMFFEIFIILRKDSKH